MFDPTVLLVIVVVLALAFDFSNGWHDSANAIATVVSTHVLSPGRAVLMAAVLNIAGAFMSTAVAMGLGTAAGGWRIVKTLGMRIIKMEPVHGFAAETSAALILLGTAHFGMPVSTTHTITSSIMGVGAVKRLSAVRWGVTMRIVYAWLFTLPGAGLMAYGMTLLFHAFR